MEPLHAPHTTMTITALGDPVLAMPPGLDERQQALARAALANIPPPPRSLPPRLIGSEAMQLPVVGWFAGLMPPLVQRWCRHALMGPRGIGNVTSVELAVDLRGNSRHFYRVTFDYLVDGELYRAIVRANSNDADDALSARVVPIVVDAARPASVIVWWSALDVR